MINLLLFNTKVWNLKPFILHISCKICFENKIKKKEKGTEKFFFKLSTINFQPLIHFHRNFKTKLFFSIILITLLAIGTISFCMVNGR